MGVDALPARAVRPAKNECRSPIKVREIAAAARTIREREHQQAELPAAGSPLFQQLRFAEYLNKHAADPSCTLRVHLQAIGRANETWRLRRIMSALRAVDKEGAVLEGEEASGPLA